MPGVVARRSAAGTALSAAATTSAPLAAVGGAGTGDAPAAEAAAAAPARKVANEDDFTHEVREFATWEEAKAAFPSLHKPKQDTDGFYLTSTTGSPTKQSYAAVMAMCSSKKTAHMPWTNLKIGDVAPRKYVGYRAMDDPTSAVWVIRVLTRIR
jgi:hypothetical protein